MATGLGLSGLLFRFFLRHHRHHLAHRLGASRSALLAPGLESFHMFLELAVIVRVFEHRAHRRQDWLEPFPDQPLLAGIFEEKFFVDQPAVHHAGRHIPIGGHHAHRGVLGAVRRTDFHGVFHGGRLEMAEIPFARFAHSRFPAQIVKTQQQVGLFVRNFSHDSLLSFISTKICCYWLVLGLSDCKDTLWEWLSMISESSKASLILRRSSRAASSLRFNTVRTCRRITVPSRFRASTPSTRGPSTSAGDQVASLRNSVATRSRMEIAVLTSSSAGTVMSTKVCDQSRLKFETCPMRLLGMETMAPAVLRSTVRRRVMCSTRPVSPFTCSMSPSEYWSSKTMKIPLIRSFNRLCAPKARATLSTPAVARAGAMSKPRILITMSAAMTMMVVVPMLCSKSAMVRVCCSCIWPARVGVFAACTRRKVTARSTRISSTAIIAITTSRSPIRPALSVHCEMDSVIR